MGRVSEYKRQEGHGLGHRARPRAPSGLTVMELGRPTARRKSPRPKKDLKPESL